MTGKLEGSSEKKFSHKGVSKALNKNLQTFEMYLKVLETQQPSYGINKGFLLKNNNMVMYEQVRRCLSALYLKRHLADDGISTRPLITKTDRQLNT